MIENLFKLLVSLLLAAAPVAILVRDWKYHDRRTKRHHHITRFILVVWLFASLLSLFLVWRETRVASRLSQEVSELVQGKNELLLANQELRDSLEEKTRQIVRLSEANVALSDHVSKSITGGGSFCYFVHAFPVGTANKLMRMLLHVGRYPLHDLNIRIADGNKLEQVFEEFGIPVPMEEIEKAQTRMHKTTFFKAGQGTAGLDTEYLTLPENTDKQTYSIFFTARNGSWHQQITLRRVNGKWRLATRVTKDGGKTLLMPEEISAEFPRDANGEALW